MEREFSAGGLVERGGKVLLVKVCNLKRELVWTFPKGHIEKGETAPQAALREVEEETGWNCRVLAPLYTAAYRFTRQRRLVSKRVRWFKMRPIKKMGKPDADEVKAVQWVTKRRASRLLRYPSDLKLLKIHNGG